MEAREGPFRLGVQSRGFRRGSPFSTGKAASFAVRKAGIAPLLLKEGLLMNGQTTIEGQLEGLTSRGQSRTFFTEDRPRTVAPAGRGGPFHGSVGRPTPGML